MYNLKLTQHIDLLIIVILYCTVFLLVAPSSIEFATQADPGTQLTKGMAILSGRHPFIHVHNSVYGPAIFYLSAFGQWVDSEGILPEIIIIFFGYLVSFVSLAAIIKIRTRRSTLVFVFGILSLIAFPRFHKYHVLLSPVIFIISLHLANHNKKILQCAMILGIGSALGGLFRLDFGAYFIFSSLIYLFIRWHLLDITRLFKGIIFYLFTGLLVVSPWLIFIFSHGIGITELVTTTMQTLMGTREGLAMPMPKFNENELFFTINNRLFFSFSYFKFFLFGAILLLLIHIIKNYWIFRKKQTIDVNTEINTLEYNTDGVFTLTLILVVSLCFLGALFRPDLSHARQVYPLIVFSSLLFLHTLDQTVTCKSFAVLSNLIIFSCLCLVSSALISARLTQIERYSTTRIFNTLTSWLYSKDKIIATGLHHSHNSRQKNFFRALSEVKTLSLEREPVLFLPFMAQAYFFTDRLFETPFAWLVPGRFLHPGSEKNFINSIRNTRIILDHPIFDFNGKKNGNARDYAPMLMHYLYSDYRILNVVGNYVILSNHPPQKSKKFYSEENFLKYNRAMDWQYSTGAYFTNTKIKKINFQPITPNQPATIEIPILGNVIFKFSKNRTLDKNKWRCNTVGLTSVHGQFIVQKKNDYIPITKLQRGVLIGTQELAPGRYQIVLLHQPSCSATTNNDLPSFLAKKTDIWLHIKEKHYLF